MNDTCTVIDIAGDYAIIKYDSTGAEGQVALALLPEGLNVGDRLRRDPGNHLWGVLAEPVKGDHQQAAQQGAHEPVEAVLKALFKAAAHAVDRADAGKAGVPAPQHIVIEQRHDQR